MRRIRITIVLAALVANGCAVPNSVSRPGGPHPNASLRVRVDDRVVSVPLEAYVHAVILSELAPRAAPASVVERMLAMQAILSRTYALRSRHRDEGFDLCSTSHCQLYAPERAASSRWSDAAKQAVHNTAGTIVWFGNRPAQVVYHADCGGRTSDARDVWNSANVSYLSGMFDEHGAATIAPWRFAAVGSTLLAALNADERTRVGGRLDRIDVLRRDGAGRAQIVALHGERTPVVRGEELRMVLTRVFGARAFRSTWFEVARTPEGFEFTGRGFGHGVGLCQAGALARLAAGATPAAVLSHYFPGTSVR